MLIGFTGSQSGLTQWQKEQVEFQLKEHECTEFVHGDCIGADLQATCIAVECGVKIFTIHPPLHDYKRAYWMNPHKMNMHLNPNYYEVGELRIKWTEPFPYLTRNKHIVDSVPLIIACPKEHKHSIRSGTWSTIRYAWKVKKDVIIIPPIERPNTEYTDVPYI